MCVHPAPCLPRPAPPRPGVLHSGSADFESVDDLVEAVGELLQEVSGDSKDDAGIRAVCQRMYNTLRLYVAGAGGREQGLTAQELLPSPNSALVAPPCWCRAEPQSQGNSQVLLDAPIQLSKMTENYGEEGILN